MVKDKEISYSENQEVPSKLEGKCNILEEYIKLIKEMNELKQRLQIIETEIHCLHRTLPSELQMEFIKKPHS